MTSSSEKEPKSNEKEVNEINLTNIKGINTNIYIYIINHIIQYKLRPLQMD